MAPGLRTRRTYPFTDGEKESYQVRRAQLLEETNDSLVRRRVQEFRSDGKNEDLLRAIA
jgi:hypothetical protein